MKERALLFGEHRSLVGVVTLPEPGAEIHPVAILILNAGLIHHVGPNRLHVKLARRLAAEGFVVMRFDFSGIGDSRARPDPMPFPQMARRETRQCMDYLEEALGIHRFVIVGLCSGADNAIRASRSDQRILGAALVEAYAVPSVGHFIASYRKRLLHPGRWWRLIRGRSELWEILKRIDAFQRALTGSGKERRKEQTPEKAAEPEASEEEAIIPSPDELLSDLRRLADRGVRLLLVNIHGSASHYNYKKILERPLAPYRAKDRVTEATVRGSDHVFSWPESQRALFQLLEDWIRGVAKTAPSQISREKRQETSPAAATSSD